LVHLTRFTISIYRVTAWLSERRNNRYHLQNDNLQAGTENTKDKNESKKDTEKLGEHYGIIKGISEPATVKNTIP
jgi:hypothetical protein